MLGFPSQRSRVVCAWWLAVDTKSSDRFQCFTESCNNDWCLMAPLSSIFGDETEPEFQRHVLKLYSIPHSDEVD